MHVIIILIMTLEITYTSRAPEGQSKIVLDIHGFGGAPMVTIAHLIHAVHWAAIHTWNSMYHMWQEKQNVAIEKNGKYLISQTSILSKSMDARSYIDFLLNFVSFKTSTIVNPIDEGKGYSGECWEDVNWRTNLPYIGLHRDLATGMRSCERVELTLLNRNDKMFVRSTNTKMSSFESDSMNTLSSVGSYLTCATEGVWTVDVSDSFVNITVEDCT